MTELESCIAEYVKRGWPVFPLKPKNKIPLTNHGFKDATLDTALIKEWWAKWPDAGIGIVTGALSGLAVIDVDPRNGGEDSLRELEKFHGILSDTPQVVTGGGGFHYYFRIPPGKELRCKHNALGRGVDLKADGGYVCAPPSLHPSGKKYEWEVSCGLETTLADLPGWVAALLSDAPIKNTAMPSGGKIDFKKLGHDSLAFLTMAQPIPLGEQRTRICGVARAILAAGGSVEQASDLIFKAISKSPQRPEEPWTLQQITELTDSIAKSPAPPMLGEKSLDEIRDRLKARLDLPEKIIRVLQRGVPDSIYEFEFESGTIIEIGTDEDLWNGRRTAQRINAVFKPSTAPLCFTKEDQHDVIGYYNALMETTELPGVDHFSKAAEWIVAYGSVLMVMDETDPKIIEKIMANLNADVGHSFISQKTGKLWIHLTSFVKWGKLKFGANFDHSHATLVFSRHKFTNEKLQQRIGARVKGVRFYVGEPLQI